MNMTYESIKERGALMVVPSDMVSSMSGFVGMAAAGFEGPHRAGVNGGHLESETDSFGDSTA